VLASEASYKVGSPELIGVVLYDGVDVKRGDGERVFDGIGRLKFWTGRCGA
jgi:hypothetical protein